MTRAGEGHCAVPAVRLAELLSKPRAAPELVEEGILGAGRATEDGVFPAAGRWRRPAGVEGLSPVLESRPAVHARD